MHDNKIKIKGREIIMTLKRMMAFGLLFALIVGGAACKKNKDPGYVTEYSYQSGDPTAAQTTLPGGAPELTTAAAQSTYTVNTSWQKNFTAVYKYFDRNTSADTVTIEEKRCDTAFSASYPATGNLLFYRANGSNIDFFTLIPSQAQYVHTLIENKSINDISTTFMKLTTVTPELPTLSNVLFMADETVAGRPCKKYIQRAYADGAVTETVYVWVDTQFGFAMKCEDYDKESKLRTYWEVTAFTSGSVTLSDFDSINIQNYTFTEG